MKDFEINASLICLGNVSNDWSADKVRNTGLYGQVYDSSVGYDKIDVTDTLGIYKYLTKKHDRMSS